MAARLARAAARPLSRRVARAASSSSSSSALCVAVLSGNDALFEADELRVAMQRMGMGAADAAAAARRAAADADGAITFGEFCAAMAPVYSNNRQMLRRAFDTFDADGSGFIDRQELASMLSKLGIAPASEQLLEAVFRDADTNGDGKVSYDEFVAMLGKELHTPPPVRGS